MEPVNPTGHATNPRGRTATREYTVAVECVRLEQRLFVARAESEEQAKEKAIAAAQARGYETREAEVKDSKSV